LILRVHQEANYAQNQDEVNWEAQKDLKLQEDAYIYMWAAHLENREIGEV